MSNLNAIQKIVSSTQDRSFQLLEESKGLVNKWAKTGLLEGVDSEYDRASISILLENQAKQLITESSRTGTAAGSEEWSGVALPLVRRIFGEIAAKDFVSVQPMSLPSGLVFYLDFKYGTTNQQGFATTNTSQLPSQAGYQANSVFGVTNTAGDPNGGLYGAGRFGYSIATVSASVASTTYVSASVTSPVSYNFDSRWFNTYSASVAFASSSVKTITVPSSSIPNFDTEGIRAFNISSSTGTITVFPQFTSINSDNSQITFLVSGSGQGFTQQGAPSFGTLTVFYEVQPTAANRGDFEAGNQLYGTTGAPIDANINIPEINVEMRSEPIVAKTRKLKAIWTPEFAQDLNAYHAIDAEAELTSMLSEYISQEIDLEILDMLIQSAVTIDAWSAVIGRSVDVNGIYSNPNPTSANAGITDGATGAFYNQQTWFQTLGTKIQKVSNAIHQKTMRGGANFLVCSPTVATILESIPGYAADTDGNKMQFAMGVQKVGMMNSRFQVYKNPYMLENTILMGYRGNQFLETGAVYSPYVPLIMTPLVYDPNNFTPRKGVMTRYAKKIVRPEFYGVIRIMDLNRI
jgi:hypothetical protein